jgi:hypothetical protein
MISIGQRLRVQLIVSTVLLLAVSRATAQTNTAYGTEALQNNTSTGNSAFRFNALYSNLSKWNTAVGYNALNSTGAFTTVRLQRSLSSSTPPASLIPLPALPPLKTILVAALIPPMELTRS